MTKYYLSPDAPVLPDFNLENTDMSLNGHWSDSLEQSVKLNKEQFNQVFFESYKIDYLSDYFHNHDRQFRVVTHPKKTNTCFEKAGIMGSWDPLNVIKVFYFEIEEQDALFAVVIPETGCFINKEQLKSLLNMDEGTILKKAVNLPDNMNYGTCNPFITDKDLKQNGGRVEKIIFDTETLVLKKNAGELDDFSFGMDHRVSVQMNYYDCFRMLKSSYPKVITDQEVLNLSFKEKFVRNKGKIKVSYEFDALNYRTARFINSIHGHGDVSIINDYVDELDLPDVLIAKK